MSTPPIVIDTCSFRDRNFIKTLGNYHGKKIISAITYSEMQIYLISKKKKEPSYFDRLLRGAGIEVEDYSKENGLQTALYGVDMGDFSRLFRDYSIASHAHIAPWIVVTYNVKDFSFLNDRVLTPQDFINDHIK
ncbi:MAG: PIN domain-containing protein [Thermoplasmataceae archaeon]